MRGLSQDARRREDALCAFARRETRRAKEAARIASNTPQSSPRVEPMKGVAERERIELRQRVKAEFRANKLRHR